MKYQFCVFLFIIIFFVVGTPSANAEFTGLFGRPNSVTFQGENSNWTVMYRMYLTGTETDYDIKIIYKGNNDNINNSSNIHYSIEDGQSTLAGVFSLNDSNVFKKKRSNCEGCIYLDKENEIKIIIGEWTDYKESLILKRLKPN